MPYKYDDLCIEPSPDLVIWRYMSLEKFESLLKNKALFFCRADRFSDPFEGSIPRREAEFRIENRRREAANSNQEFKYEQTLDMIDALANAHRLFKKMYTINCWHLNSNENDSMWRLYLKSNEGVAIKTTVRKLLNSFQDTDEIILCSKVRYLDYENDIWYDPIEHPRNAYNFFTPLIHKRIEFQQEAEIRLLHEIKEYRKNDINQFWEQQSNEKGLSINVDVEILIEDVCSPPTSDDWQIEKIREMILKYGFEFEVSRSQLSKEPYY